ncbi:MAG: hypothetical protein K0S33_3999 [Bacteroidetes bacterium]|jgi:hypothetical protein|nr:hypothetical protein [Bacteroidota bacterium]
MILLKTTSAEGTLYNGHTVLQWRNILTDTALREEDVQFFVDHYTNEDSLSFIIPELQKRHVREILILGMIMRIFDLGLIGARDVYRRHGGYL